MKKGAVTIFFVISLVLVSAGLVNAEKRISDAGVKYDSEIFEGNEWYKGFDEGAEWVPVLIEIKDISNIFIDYEKDSRDIQTQKWNEKKKILNNSRFEVLNSLFEEDFEVENNIVGAYAFSGDISRGGFDDILNNNKILKVNIKSYGSVDSANNLKKSYSFWSIFTFLLIVILIILFFVIKRK